MSIDKIGKGTPVSPTSAVDAGTRIEEKPFHLQSSASVTRAETSPLEQVRAGQITLPQYLDAHVEQATAHLTSRLSPDQLSFIRQNLRAELASDPALAALVRSATGSASPPPDSSG